jgi:hypothetical protein
MASDKHPLFVSPLFHLKALACAHTRKEEIAGIGIVTKDDPFYVQDLVLCEGVYSGAYCDVEADDLARCVMKALDLGYSTELHTVWFHTHPFQSNKPSTTDETTFRNLFSARPLITQLILCTTGEYYGASMADVGNHRIRIEHDVYPHWDYGLPINFDPAAFAEEMKSVSRARSIPNYQSYYNQGSGLSHHASYRKDANGNFAWTGGSQSADDSAIFDEDLMEWVPKADMDKPELVARRADCKKNNFTNEHLAALRRLHHRLFLKGVPDSRYLHETKSWKEWAALIKRSARFMTTQTDEQMKTMQNPNRVFPVNFDPKQLPPPIKEALTAYVKELRTSVVEVSS